MPACLRCRTVVDTNVLLNAICCSVQGRLKAVLPWLGHVDTGAALELSLCFRGVSRRKSGLKCESYVIANVLRRRYA